MRMLTINEFLTDDEIEQAIQLYKTLVGTGKFASTLASTVIRPNIERINKVTGQENEPMYLAYMVEYVIGEVVRIAG